MLQSADRSCPVRGPVRPVVSQGSASAEAEAAALAASRSSAPSAKTVGIALGATAAFAALIATERRPYDALRRSCHKYTRAARALLAAVPCVGKSVRYVAWVWFLEE